MIQHWKRLLVIAVVALCNHGVLAQSPSVGDHLFVWAGDADRQDSDFLAVLDVRPAPDRYGKVLATVPVDEKSLWPHHTEHEFGPTGTLFANGFAANRTFVFDLRDPLQPRVTARFGAVGGLSFPHSFARLPSGNVVVTFQGHGDQNEVPGGLAELDERGQVVRSVSAADPSAEAGTLRPYSLAVVPALDRVVVGLTYMGFPPWTDNRSTIAHDHTGSQVQIRRLSDLGLVKTLKLKSADGPHEPRLLNDGRTVLVGTISCRVYRVADLETDEPSLVLAHDSSSPGCWVPVVIGNYWVQAHTDTKQVFSLDVRDPADVREASTLQFDERQYPHWLATDGRRLVVVNDARGEHRIWIANIDPGTGRLTLDDAFREEGADRAGFSFDRAEWPHGATGDAVPHGTVFGP